MTTNAILSCHTGLVEANPPIRAAAGALGHLGVVSLKPTVFLALIAGSMYLARAHGRYLSHMPPLALAVSGGLVTAHNLVGLAGWAGRSGGPRREPWCSSQSAVRPPAVPAPGALYMTVRLLEPRSLGPWLSYSDIEFISR